MRIASWSWGGRQHAGTVSADGREATPLAVSNASRGALEIIERLKPEWRDLYEGMDLDLESTGSLLSRDDTQCVGLRWARPTLRRSAGGPGSG